MTILKTLLNVGSMTTIMLIMMLKQGVIIISVENIEALLIEIVILILN